LDALGGKQLRKATLGFKDVYYAVKTGETYGTPKRLHGARGFKPEAQNTQTTIYADDTAYLTLNKNNGVQGNLEMYDITDEFYCDVLGKSLDANGGLVNEANLSKPSFALLFESTVIDSDTLEVPMRFVFYNCTANEPSFGFTTKEEGLTVDVQTMQITATPIELPMFGATVSYRLEKSAANAAVFDAFFDAVPFPVPVVEGEEEGE
jgi:phi13 family phage major tail protein